MPAVISSVIADISYHEATATMEIRFKRGAKYTYYDVPRSVYEEFIEAESIGRYFNANIRRKYRDGPEQSVGW